MINLNNFFDISPFKQSLPNFFDGIDAVWELLSRINPYLDTIFPQQAAILGEVHPQAILLNKESIYIGSGTKVEAGAYIAGPAYIGANCHIRHGAYIRGGVIAGDKSVLGHSSEFKNALLFPNSHAAHFAYVGDSVLGHRVNLGAGTKLSNLGVFSDNIKAATGQRPTIKIKLPGHTDPIDTGLAKIGAILADDVQTGCNVVTNPGCLVAKSTLIYSNVSLPKGYWPPQKIIKLRQQLEQVDLK